MSGGSSFGGDPPPHSPSPPQPDHAIVSKIPIFLRSIGDAPVLKRQKFKIDGSKTVLYVERFIARSIACADAITQNNFPSVVLYCGSGFSPSYEQTIGSLFELFQTSGELVITYGIQEAWG